MGADAEDFILLISLISCSFSFILFNYGCYEMKQEADKTHLEQLMAFFFFLSF